MFGANAPGNRVTLGLIGTGRQAMGMNIPEFMAVPGVQVVAVCDVDSWRLGEARQLVEAAYAKQAPGGTYKGVAAYRDFRELLARPDIDAVMISMPDHWHVPIAAACTQGRQGRVAGEADYALPSGTAAALVDLAAKHKRVFRVDSEFRSLKRFHRAVELVRNGRSRLSTIRSGSPVEEFPEESEAVAPVPPELDYDLWLGPAPEVPDIQEARPCAA